MMNSDESITGLLLRAHRETSAQAHGERYHLKNTSAAMSYDTAISHIEDAIRAVQFAELAVQRQKSSQESAEAIHEQD